MAIKRIDAHLVRSWSTPSGAIAGLLRFLKDERTLHYQMGTTGFAFRTNVGDQACPSSPCAFNWEHFLPRALMLLGYDCTFVQSFKSSFLFEKRLEEAHSLVRRSIDEGVPVIGWHLDLPEFGVIRGYDDDKRLFHVDTVLSEPGERTLEFAKLGQMDTEALFVLRIGERFETDESVCAKRAIEYALFHSASESPISKNYETGMQAYNKWMDALLREDVDPFGNSYNPRVLLEARIAAADYLRSVGGLFADEDREMIEDAAVHYDQAADAFMLFSGLFAFPGDEQLLKDKLNLQKGIGWLSRARSEEQKALELLAQVSTDWRSGG